MQAVATPTSARITVRKPDGSELRHDITPDDSLIVGSSQTCSLRLESSDIASMHCLIRLENGRLRVQDWYTALGTFLNGERLQRPADFGPGDELRIGDFRLTAQYLETDPEPKAKPSKSTPSASLRTPNSPPASPAGGDEEFASLAEWARESDLGDANSAFDQEYADDDAETTGHSGSEFKELKLRITELELENDELRLKTAAWEDSSPAGDVDPFDLEMVDLLKAEVQQLQDEVAQRDARVAELAEAAAVGGPSGHRDEHNAENETLIERIDQLLEDLQRGDERSAALEDLLRSADEATRAEKEERRQLEAWVGDIEEKIGEREGEWKASQAALQKRIDDLVEQKERFDERLKDLGNREGTAASARLIEDLRDEAAQLRRKLDSTEEARDALRKKIDDVEFQNAIEHREKYVEQKLREQRLDMAQEQAQIARDRAEITRMKAEVQIGTATSGPALDDATCRVQAFREHLKDIHKEESKDRESKKLSSRLARLWKRLEGN